MYSKKDSSLTRPKRAAGRKNTSRNGTLLQLLLCSYPLTLAVAAIALLSGSLGAYFSPDPLAYSRPIGYLCAGVTALIGGMLAARRVQQPPLLAALENALLLSATLLVLSFLLGSFGSSRSLLLSLGLHATILALSLLGAAITLRRTPKGKRKKRNKKRR